LQVKKKNVIVTPKLGCNSRKLLRIIVSIAVRS
jgi:hypothetical protein